VNAFAPAIMTASAGVILALGVAHLVLTFRGRKLHPRDGELEARMREVSPVITAETTMWKTWIGFNASHSYGAILFGLVYGYLAIAHGALLFGSPFLLVLGIAFLFAWLFLGVRYWFSVPRRGITLATLLYALAVAASWM
jgi:hypothetical protein